MRSADAQTNEVTVLFKEAALMFALPRGATLGELAARLAGIEERQFGEPLTIAVKLRH
jgi:hypothetical protein